MSRVRMQGRADRFSESGAIPGHYRIAVAAGTTGVPFEKGVPGHAAPFWEPGLLGTWPCKAFFWEPESFAIAVTPGVHHMTGLGKRAGTGGSFWVSCRA